MFGCSRSTKPSVAKPPIEMSWGKAGEAPTMVYQAYPWVIMSMDHYTAVCK
jgi:hypothetical protein